MTYTTGATWNNGRRKENTSLRHEPSDGPVDLRMAHTRNLKEARPMRDHRAQQPKTHRYNIDFLQDDGSVRHIDHVAPAELFLEDICAAFARGTLISTENGQVAVEDLVPGDRIKTRDNGYQRLRWISHCPLVWSQSDAESEPDTWPLRISAEALGVLRPDHDIVVSPRFRVLTNHPSCTALFGSPETLAPVVDLLDGEAIMRVRPSSELEFYNLMLDTHQIIEVNGLETESYHPGNFGVAVMSLEMQSHLRRIFPHLDGDLASFGRTARPILKGFEAEVLRVS